MRMKNHRIIKKTYMDGNTYYRVQERIFYFFWTNVKRDYFFYMHLSLINTLNRTGNHPANLVGKSHSEYIDALEEISYLQSCQKSRKIVKKETIEAL